MENFEQYSQYYDLLYKDKDYQAETDYVAGLIGQYGNGGKKVIELGSGTGIHARLLAQKGFSILGIERSASMVEIANSLPVENVEFQHADITTFQSTATFDIALSLFHVVSYLTGNKELIATFEHVNKALCQHGLFIFDVWHTPAVNHQVPEEREKRLQNENIEVVRKATPIIFPEQNVVEVNYEIKVKEINGQSQHNFKEKHPMRHFGRPELELLAYATGFEILHSEEFLTQASPSVDTWGVCYLFRKR